MSDIKDAIKLSMLEQRADFLQQQEQLRIQFHQLQGAISVCDQVLEKLEGDFSKNVNGDCQYDDTNKQEQIETPQE